MGSLQGYALTRTYEYRDPQGHLLFCKQRWELLDPLSGMRKKTFRYYDPRSRRRVKPLGADRYLYRLDKLAVALESDATVHWAEGEKDADALVRAGVEATSHHQGAGRVTLDQAAWLRSARCVVLWVDLDRGNWEVGAYDAALRFNLLIDVGLGSDQIRLVRARRGKDAHDHLAAGLSVASAVPVDRNRLAAVARRYEPKNARKLGYGHA